MINEKIRIRYSDYEYDFDDGKYVLCADFAIINVAHSILTAAIFKEETHAIYQQNLLISIMYLALKMSIAENLIIDYTDINGIRTEVTFDSLCRPTPRIFGSASLKVASKLNLLRVEKDEQIK